MISLLAPFWRTGNDLTNNSCMGLYFYCDDLNDICQRFGGNGLGSTGWFRVVQVFYPVSVLLALVSAVSTLIYVRMRNAGAKAGWNFVNFILLTAVLGGLLAVFMNIIYMIEVHVDSPDWMLDFCAYFNWVILPLLVTGALLVRQSHVDYPNNDVSAGQFDMMAILNRGKGQNLVLLSSLAVTVALAMSVISLLSPFWQSPAHGVIASDLGLFYEVNGLGDAVDLNTSNPWLIFCQVYYTLSTCIVLVSAAATLRYALLRRDSSPVGRDLISTSCYSALIAAGIDIFVVIAYKYEVFNYSPGFTLDFCWHFNIAVILLLVTTSAAVRQSFRDYEAKSSDASSGMPALPYGQEYKIALGVPMVAAAAVMSVISCLAPYWAVNDVTDRSDGLYYYCRDGDCSNLKTPPTGGLDTWWRAAQVFYPFSTTLALLAVVFLVLYLLKRNAGHQFNVGFAHAVFVVALHSAFFALFVTIGFAEGVFVPGKGKSLGVAFYFNYAIIPLLVFGGWFVRQSRRDFNAIAPAPTATA